MACLLQFPSDPNRVQLPDLQQINTVNLIHTPSSEPSQNKANEHTHGPWRDSSAERQALADSSLSADTCRSAHGKQPAENHRYHHHRNFKQYSCWMNSYCSEVFDNKHDNRMVMLVVSHFYLPELSVCETRLEILSCGLFRYRNCWIEQTSNTTYWS